MVRISPGTAVESVAEIPSHGTWGAQRMVAALGSLTCLITALTLVPALMSGLRKTSR